MLKNDPDISIFYGTSALDSLGIIEGMKKKNGTNDIRVYAFDTVEETIDLMKKGDIHMTLKQEPYEMGDVGVQLLIDLIQGKEIEKQYFTPMTLLRKEDVER
jgi:ribose transport system substrate-binding protein